MRLHANLNELRGVVIDMDGTIYVGETLFPWTMTFLDVLEEAGIHRLFLTNNSAESTAEYAVKLRRMGIPVDETEVLTAGWATIHYLKTDTPHRRIYLLGTSGLRREFEQGGLTVVNDIETDVLSDAPDAVVLGFDMTITYRRIRSAAELIQAGTPFIATHPDPVCPKENGLIPDCGSMIELLVPAAGKRPFIIGKPHSRMVDAALARLGTTREQTAIIGDLLPTDMQMARQNGLMGILVLSGETSKQDVENCEFTPDLVVQNAGEFASLLRAEIDARRQPVSG